MACVPFGANDLIPGGIASCRGELYWQTLPKGANAWIKIALTL